MYKVISYFIYMTFRNCPTSSYSGDGQDLTKETSRKNEYADTEKLRNFLDRLQGKKFMLDCGHRVTFGFYLGNDIIIRNGKVMKIVCADCGG